MRSGALLVAALVAVGCGTPEWALVGGRRVARPTVAYDNGETFRLEHRRAFPGVFDPARGRDIDDGTLRGRVCGVDLAFDAIWFGARLTLDGRGEVPWRQDFTHTEGLFKLDLTITEREPGHRRIVGSMPGGGASAAIDLDVSAERLVGQVGLRHFTLAADGGYLVGRYRRSAEVLAAVDETFAIWGREALGTMVPADEALLLVLMLTCDGTVELDGKRVRGFSLVRLAPRS